MSKSFLFSFCEKELLSSRACLKQIPVQPLQAPRDYGTVASQAPAPEALTMKRLCIAVALLIAGPAAAQTETILYTTNAPVDGNAVLSGLLPGPSGSFYAVAQQGGANDNGTAFRVNRPAAGSTAYTGTLLWTFDGTDANGPASTLIANAAGDLFGTAPQGGKNFNGVVFELIKPTKPGTAWTETNIVDQFSTLTYGDTPAGSLVAGPGGVLYGVTEDGGSTANEGVVFQLTPPATAGGAWTDTVIWRFTGAADGGRPVAGLVRASTGTLYGTTDEGGTGTCGCGVVFSLTPPATAGGAWTQATLHTFAGPDGSYPQAKLILAGTALYGTTSSGGAGNGTVFRLTPPAKGQTAWHFTSLYSFNGTSGSGPLDPLIRDTKGNLFGTTNLGGSAGLGAVFRLTPPDTAKGAWTETVLHSFLGGGVDGYQPFGGLVADKAGNLYGTTRSGGVTGGDSTIYEITSSGYVP
jgi:hypothetical protein